MVDNSPLILILRVGNIPGSNVFMQFARVMILDQPAGNINKRPTIIDEETQIGMMRLGCSRCVSTGG